jgi:RecB family exonuclease
VITPRRTRLVRVPDLHAFRRTIVLLTSETPRDLFHSAAAVVPTRGAAHQLLATVGGSPHLQIVTRDELYGDLNGRLATPLRRLTACDREVLLHAASTQAIAVGQAPPFDLRPGLLAEMLRFYDQLRRQRQSVRRFEELIRERLEGDEDRGAVRLLEQTRFLAAAYREYENRLGGTDAVDEHALREHLIATPAASPLTDLIVAVGDWIADIHGLAAVDFDLLTRIPGLERIDVVVTERVLRSGLHERLHDWLPGLEECDGRTLGVAASRLPREIVTPVSRDREEELAGVAKRFISQGAGRTAVVFERPLPYLYLAREVFANAGVEYQTTNALPLAVEPVVAALDLVLEFVSSHFSRDSTLSLLASPHFVFEPPQSSSPNNLAALDRDLVAARYLGEFEKLSALAFDNPSFAAAVSAAEKLLPLLDPAPASAQLNTLRAFVTSHAGSVADARADRGRAAVLQILGSMASAYAAHGDRHVAIDDLAPEIRRWLEDATFAHSERQSRGDIHLLDAQAARFGDFDDVTLVGLVEGEWPERPRRNIFYAPSVLGALGWPSERDRRSAITATFLDLVTSASRSVVMSTFTLDDEALVEPSSLLEDAAGLGLSKVESIPTRGRMFADDALSFDPVDLERVDGGAREWAQLRMRRSDRRDERFHGGAGPQPSVPVSVSAVESYLTCPFKYFAQHVLRLEEERDEEDVMDPKTQGRFVHAVFEAFFTAWQESGRRGITPDNLDEARTLFARIVEEKVRPLPEAEAALERTRLLGSPVAAGLGEVVFQMEAERPTPVLERLLEYRLKGDFEFAGPDGARSIALKGVADRIDLLEDGTLRLVDYKLSSAPSKSRALQLPIYGLCAEQRLKSYKGRQWTLGEAAYIAFRGSKRVTPLFTARTDRGQVMADAQTRLIDAVDRIERGEFPPTPEDVFLCGFCSHGAVCRKDYVGDV